MKLFTIMSNNKIYKVKAQDSKSAEKIVKDAENIQSMFSKIKNK